MTSMPQFFPFPKPLPPVCRLGLATRGNASLQAEDLWFAMEQGINYWNWCGYEDGMAQAIRELGPRRKQVVIAVQLDARDGEVAKRELEELLEQLGTHYLDVVTFYYVEHDREWQEIRGPAGALTALRSAQQEGLVRLLGLTTHQRGLAARIVRSQLLDLLMVRYNAAHRGAEQEIFPIAVELRTPLITFTSMRWNALLHRTPDDPPGFRLPPPRDWYRFVLAHPAVSVALMAPANRSELLHNLQLLNHWVPLPPRQYEELRLHGERVRRHAGEFV